MSAQICVKYIDDDQAHPRFQDQYDYVLALVQSSESRILTTNMRLNIVDESFDNPLHCIALSNTVTLRFLYGQIHNFWGSLGKCHLKARWGDPLEGSSGII